MRQRQLESAGVEVMHPGSVSDVAVSVVSRKFVAVVAAVAALQGLLVVVAASVSSSSAAALGSVQFELQKQGGYPA